MGKQDFFGKRSLLYTSSSSLFESENKKEEKEVLSIKNTKLMGKVTGNEGFWGDFFREKHRFKNSRFPVPTREISKFR